MRDYKKPVFTSKHYETIVDLLSDIKVHSGFTESTVLEYFKELFEEDNKRFNIIRFMNTYYKQVKEKTEQAYKAAQGIY